MNDNNVKGETPFEDPGFAKYFTEDCAMGYLNMMGYYDEYRTFEKIKEIYVDGKRGLSKFKKVPDLLGQKASGYRNGVDISDEMKWKRSIAREYGDFQYEYKGHLFSHEHKSKRHSRNGICIFPPASNMQQGADGKDLRGFIAFGAFDVLSVHYRDIDRYVYFPFFRFPLATMASKNFPTRYKHHVPKAIERQFAKTDLIDVLDDIIENYDAIEATKKECFEWEQNYFNNEGSNDQRIVTDQKITPTLERFF